jgi:hypothetical protein
MLWLWKQQNGSLMAVGRSSLVTRLLPRVPTKPHRSFLGTDRCNLDGELPLDGAVGRPCGNFHTPVKHMNSNVPGNSFLWQFGGVASE